ncbi:hypothetical protein [Pantanalinema rosaneae]|uniref:hypothetical protein n=1 Tax=Pantanalinema rosaneae TaxID=1620701 RepID=UPI003D6DE209
MQPQSQTPSCLPEDQTDSTLPSVISEGLVNQFKYWHQTIQRGMYYNNDLYTYFQSYPLAERLKAYAMACEHTERRIGVCITVSKTHYSVWLNLRSLSSPISESNAPDAIAQELVAAKYLEEA